MNKPEEPQTELLAFQISPEVLDVIEQAAALRSCSVNEFLEEAALAAARRTLDGVDLIPLSVEDQQRFVDLLLNPPPLSPALVRARETHHRLIGKS